MPGMGYNIPISLSSASTWSVPTSINASVPIVFGSGDLVSAGESQANPVQPATATSSAAEGNAGSSSSGSGATTGGSSVMLWVAIGVAGVAVVMSLIAVMHR
jgi:hypothetical protein